MPVYDEETGHPKARSDSEIARVRDMVIEVIDPRTRRVVVSAKTDRRLKAFLADGEAYSLTFTDDGVGVVTIWRIRLGSSATTRLGKGQS